MVAGNRSGGDSLSGEYALMENTPQPLAVPPRALREGEK